MKKHTLLSDIAVFLLIFFLLIVPPFFVSMDKNTSPLFNGWGFPWYQTLLAVLCVVILFFYYEKQNKRTLIIAPVLITYGMLFSVSLFCRFLSEFLKSKGIDSGMYEAGIVLKPDSFIKWMNCLILFLTGAFYEEVLYRFYFIDMLFSLITRKKVFRFSRLLCEIAGLVIFAFAHFYMGWIAVLNAAIAHIFLRRCYLHTGKLWPCVVSHFIYNVVSLILL